MEDFTPADPERGNKQIQKSIRRQYEQEQQKKLDAAYNPVDPVLQEIYADKKTFVPRPARFEEKTCEFCNEHIFYDTQNEEYIPLNSKRTNASLHICSQITDNKQISSIMHNMLNFLQNQIRSKKEKNFFGFE
jgi:hypothetical protein